MNPTTELGLGRHTETERFKNELALLWASVSATAIVHVAAAIVCAARRL